MTKLSRLWNHILAALLFLLRLMIRIMKCPALGTSHHLHEDQGRYMEKFIPGQNPLYTYILVPYTCLCGPAPATNFLLIFSVAESWRSQIVWNLETLKISSSFWNFLVNKCSYWTSYEWLIEHETLITYQMVTLNFPVLFC